MKKSTYICPKCSRHLHGVEDLAGRDVQCPQCEEVFTAVLAAGSPGPTVLSVADSGRAGEGLDALRIAGKLSGQITKLAGVEHLEGFSFKEFFSEVFRRHSTEEVEEYFTVGTVSTTPCIDEVDTSWPRPWVFFKTFLGAMAIYLLFLMGWNEYESLNLIPGLIITGSFAVPLAALIFFVEVNVRRNVSLYQVIRLLFAGGILSLLISLVFWSMAYEFDLGWLGYSVAGLVEEPGKLLALLLVANIPKYRYTLNGLLFGAAVGAGFAAFESAGYALYAGLEYGEDMMIYSIKTRGMLAPFGHIVWTAMCGAALWRVKRENRFSFSMVRDARFLRIFATAVVLHMLWNTSFQLPFMGKYLLLGLVAWIIVLALIQEGLKELRAEKPQMTGESGSQPDDPSAATDTVSDEDAKPGEQP